MTTDCTHCGAATAAHMLTYIGTFRRQDERNVRKMALCPPCYTQWWAMETRDAVSLEQHPRRPRRDAV